MGGRRRVSCAGSGGRVVPISTFFFVRASGNLYFLLCAGQAGSRFSSERQGWFLISVLFSSMLGRWEDRDSALARRPDASTRIGRPELRFWYFQAKQQSVDKICRLKILWRTERDTPVSNLLLVMPVCVCVFLSDHQQRTMLRQSIFRAPAGCPWAPIRSRVAKKPCSRYISTRSAHRPGQRHAGMAPHPRWRPCTPGNSPFTVHAPGNSQRADTPRAAGRAPGASRQQTPNMLGKSAWRLRVGYQQSYRPPGRHNSGGTCLQETGQCVLGGWARERSTRGARAGGRGHASCGGVPARALYGPAPIDRSWGARNSFVSFVPWWHDDRRKRLREEVAVGCIYVRGCGCGEIDACACTCRRRPSSSQV